MFIHEFRKNKSIFYHLLDSFINDDSGNNTINVIDFINKNIINNKIKIKLYDNIFKILSDTNARFNNGNITFNIEKFTDLIKIKFDFLIIDLLFNKHSTSLIIFNREDKYNIILLNSGLGVTAHHNLNGMYKPYINLATNDIKLITNIINIIYIYNIIENNYI